jgi:hypothetical protein
MIPGGDHIDAQVIQFGSDVDRQAESGCGIFTVGYNQIDISGIHQMVKSSLNRSAPGATDDIPDK